MKNKTGVTMTHGERHDELKEELKLLSNKVDMIYSIIKDDYLGRQALDVHRAMSIAIKNTEDEAELEQHNKILKQAESAYSFHMGTVNDNIDYYAKIHGKGAEENLMDLMKKSEDEDIDSGIETDTE